MGIFKKKEATRMYGERTIPSFITKNKDNVPVDFDALAEEMRQIPRLTAYAKKPVEIEISRLDAIATLIRDCTFEELVTLGDEVSALWPTAGNLSEVQAIPVATVLNKWARKPADPFIGTIFAEEPIDEKA